MLDPVRTLDLATDSEVSSVRGARVKQATNRMEKATRGYGRGPSS